jgi:hypothetical protein
MRTGRAWVMEATTAILVNSSFMVDRSQGRKGKDLTQMARSFQCKGPEDIDQMLGSSMDHDYFHVH